MGVHEVVQAPAGPDLGQAIGDAGVEHDTPDQGVGAVGDAEALPIS